jgi:hypothetical protein
VRDKPYEIRTETTTSRPGCLVDCSGPVEHFQARILLQDTRWTARTWQLLSLSHITTITGARVNVSASLPSKARSRPRSEGRAGTQNSEGHLIISEPDFDTCREGAKIIRITMRNYTHFQRTAGTMIMKAHGLCGMRRNIWLTRIPYHVPPRRPCQGSVILDGYRPCLYGLHIGDDVNKDAPRMTPKPRLAEAS